MGATTRVHVPVTLRMLTSLVETGELRPVGGTAFALTPALRESYAAGGDDELSHVALGEAARASLRLLAVELEAEHGDEVLLRRAVLSADVDGVTLRPDLDDAVVKVPGTIAMAQVAAVHVDLADAEDAVRAAVRVVDDADLGDLDAEFVLGEAEDHELAWYASQELPFLLDLL
ncbi:hypothetical protein GCM10027047_07430 [Rhodococcus aerolatus]